MRNCQYIRNLRGSGVKRGEYISRGINLSLNSHLRSLSLSLSVRNVHNCDAQRVGRRSVGRWRSFGFETGGSWKDIVTSRRRKRSRVGRSAHCGRQVPLYRCSTECNLPRNLCTGMRQTSRNERFILAHAVPARNARYFVLIRRPALDVMHSHI